MLKKMADNQIIFTNKARCRDCYRCLRYCPVNAIKIREGQAFVEVERCILCGTCLKECPQNAKQFRRDLEKAKQLITANEKVAVSIAPSFPAIFEDWQIKRLPSVLRQLGFNYISETAEAAFFVANETKEYFSGIGKTFCLSSACPSYVTYVEKYKPEQVKNLIPVVSPMIAHARRLKQKLGEDWKVVFIGPCLAKKAEAERKEFRGLVDVVLTFTELLEWIEEEKIDIRLFEASDFDEKVNGEARLFALTGGMTKTALMETDNLNQSVHAVSGFSEITDSMNSFAGTTSHILLEPLMCSSGCVNGPGLPKSPNIYTRKESVINYSLNSAIEDTDSKVISISLSTSFDYNAAFKVQDFQDEEIRQILERTGKQFKEDQLNCGACGYPSCIENAKAILSGMVDIESCIPYMRRLAEQRTDKIIETSPNGIVILNKELEILHMNPAFSKFFMCTNSVIGKRISYLMDPEPFIKLKESEIDQIEETVHHQNYDISCHQILYKLREDEQYIGIFVDITKNVSDVEKLDSLRKKTIQQARELLDHQVEMAQQLAKLLGENTAKGEVLVENLLELTQDKQKKNKNWLRDTYTTK